MPVPQPALPTAAVVRHVLGAPADRRRALLDWRRGLGPEARVWWLVDTPAAAAAIRRELPSPKRRGLITTGVMTVRQAADLVVGRTPRLPLGPAARLALIGELAMAAGFRNALGPLEPLIGTPGLVEFLGSRFRQLRRQGIAPGEAGGALRALDGEEAGGVLARLYRDYCAAIEDGDLLDEEEAIAVAAALLDETIAPTHLALDLPQRPSAIELQFLKSLAGFAEEIVVAVPGPPAGSPADIGLGPPPDDAAPWWRGFGEPHEVLSASQSPVPAGLTALRESLFDEEPSASTPAEGIRVLASGSAQDTARRVARRVKQLLIDGAPAASIVVAAPALERAAPRYAEALREYGVPLAVDAAPRVGTAGVVRLLLDLLETVESDGAFAPLCRLLTYGGLTAFDRVPSSTDFASARGAAEWLVRELQVPSGRAYLLKQVRSLAERTDDAGAVRKLAAAARGADGVLTLLDAACDLLSTEATPLGWLDACDAALRRLGHAGIGPAAEATDRGAGDVLEEAAASVEALARWRGREPRQISLREWRSLLSAWSGRLRLPSSGGAEGRVRLVGLATATGIPCRHLFLVDAGEEAFNARDGQSSRDAMLLFYELSVAPTESLTLAYAALDDAAQPLSPSPMVVEVERRFAESLLRAGEPPPLRGALVEGTPLSQRDLRLTAVADARAGNAALLTAYGRLDGGGLVSALRSIDARAHGDAFGPWEGVFGSPGASERLGERFGPDHLWSASQLETMATCPYQFFGRQVLRLEPVGELQLGVDYRRRGSLVHDALARCLQEITKDLKPGQSLASLSADELTDRLVDEIRAQVESGKLPPHEAALAAIEARQAEGWAPLYADQQAKYDRDKRWDDQGVAMRPALLEVRFGPAKGSEADIDPASTDQPLELQLPNGETLRVAGRIDRIDTGQLGKLTLFTVIDYKTGKNYRVKLADVLSGKQLQPVLYALAAQQLLLPPGAVPIGVGYWSLLDKGFITPKEGRAELPLVVFEDGGAGPSEDWRETVERVRLRCGELVASIRSGAFPMNNPQRNCGQHCDLRTICRVAQARSLGKASVDPDTDDSSEEAE